MKNYLILKAISLILKAISGKLWDSHARTPYTMLIASLIPFQTGHNIESGGVGFWSLSKLTFVSEKCTGSFR